VPIFRYGGLSLEVADGREPGGIEGRERGAQFLPVIVIETLEEVELILAGGGIQVDVAQGTIEAESPIGAGVGATVGKEVGSLVSPDHLTAGRTVNKTVGLLVSRSVVIWGTTGSWWTTTGIESVPLLPHIGACDA
jgi:hypothetical protein